MKLRIDGKILVSEFPIGNEVFNNKLVVEIPLADIERLIAEQRMHAPAVEPRGFGHTAGLMLWQDATATSDETGAE